LSNSKANFSLTKHNFLIILILIYQLSPFLRILCFCVNICTPCTEIYVINSTERSTVCTYALPHVDSARLICITVSGNSQYTNMALATLCIDNMCASVFVCVFVNTYERYVSVRTHTPMLTTPFVHTFWYIFVPSGRTFMRTYIRFFNRRQKLFSQTWDQNNDICIWRT
jgi:hypothetical protein